MVNTVLMVRPIGFGFNAQTAVDNVFQNQLENQPSELIKQNVLAEFDAMKHRLSALGVNVLELGECEDRHQTPDAVFPNNWLVTDSKNRLSIYPMKTPNRRLEVRVDDVSTLLIDAGFKVENVIDITDQFSSNEILEGTGALVFDHQCKLAYAAVSERCQPTLAQSVCDWLGYQLVAFETRAANAQPVYHTNVVMSVGDDFVVACVECMTDPQAFLESVANSGKRLIEITMQQMEKGMCGNVIEVESNTGNRILVCSDSAWGYFSAEQKQWFEERMTIANCAIDTIEQVGGGSCRCMLAEIYNQRVDMH
jgi:hypothetical protein